MIQANKKHTQKVPLVAIHCLVYNHEPYLRDCFEGFVMQQKKIAQTEGFVEEMLHGQKVVQVFSYENEAKEKFDKISPLDFTKAT